MMVTLMHVEPLDPHHAYEEEYTYDENFKEEFQQLQIQVREEESDGNTNHHFQHGLLYKLDKICVPKEDRLQLTK